MITSNGQLATSTVPIVRTTVGYTYKTTTEIDAWNTDWQRRNPDYFFSEANCQKYVKEFCEWACEGRAKLPRMEIGVSAYAVGPTSQAVAADNRARGDASFGRCDAQIGLLGVAAEGPAANADAICGRQGFGAMADASLGHAEGKVGVFKAEVGVSVKTGAKVADGNLEASFLGFGFKIGQNGIHGHNPLFGFGIGS